MRPNQQQVYCCLCNIIFQCLLHWCFYLLFNWPFSGDTWG